MKYFLVSILLFASAAHAQDNKIILPERTFGPSPGSAWVIVGPLTPIEPGNIDTNFHIEQGRVIFRQNKVNVELYVAAGLNFDTKGYAWNNNVALQGGVKANRTIEFKHVEGVMTVGAAEAYENRWKANSAAAPAIFVEDWFGWNPAEEKASRFPGESWAVVGKNIAPVERGNVIGVVYIEQGYKLPLYAHEAQGRRMDWALIPFIEETYSADRLHYDWNNFSRTGAGLKVAMAAGMEFGASYIDERRFQSGLHAAGFSVFIKFWKGWDVRSKYQGSY